MRNAFVRAVLITAGIFYTITGMALFFAPQWFYDTIGPYPPFNRHYEGDLATVILPIGIALVSAARNPAQHRLLFGVAVASSVLHAANHLRDELVLSPSPSQLSTGSIPLAIVAAILAAVYFVGTSRRTVS
jgi:hypothetical protein